MLIPRLSQVNFKAQSRNHPAFTGTSQQDGNHKCCWFDETVKDSVILGTGVGAANAVWEGGNYLHAKMINSGNLEKTLCNCKRLQAASGNCFTNTYYGHKVDRVSDILKNNGKIPWGKIAATSAKIGAAVAVGFFVFDSISNYFRNR